MIILTVLFYVAIVIDFATTLYYINHGCYEANKLMRDLLKEPIAASLITKVVAFIILFGLHVGNSMATRVIAMSFGITVFGYASIRNYFKYKKRRKHG